MRQQTRDWQRNRDMWIRVLERQTGSGVDHWNGRIARERLRDENELRRWLTAQGVTGYARTLLVMERFGYPDFLHVSLVSPVRTFARIVPATKQRVDLGLRLDGHKPAGRLQPSKIHETMKLQISLQSLAEVDHEVLEWIARAYERNA